MTDYLELLEEENTDALLEQVRRLERALARPALENRTEGEAQGAFTQPGQQPEEATKSSSAKKKMPWEEF